MPLPDVDLSPDSCSRFIVAGWAALAVALVVPVVMLLVFGDRFAWEHDLVDVPSIAGTAWLVGAGLVFVLAVVPLLVWSQCLSAARARWVLIFVVGFGVALRVALLFSTPVLEDDFYRYLWDGGVSAHGLNPYAYAPDASGESASPDMLAELALDAGHIHDRVNHEHLKSIYPPVSQAAFALAHWIKPWDLTAWRVVCLVAELISLGLLLALLRELGRSQLWVALYWWNPIVLKEAINSAHMEAILVPFVLAAVLAWMTKRYLWAIGFLGFGVGAKLWPILLAPLFLRPLISRPGKLVTAVLLLVGLCIGWVVLPYLGGLDETSGFVAYATYWQTNSALFPLLERVALGVFEPFGFLENTVSRVVRGALGLVVAGISIAFAWRPVLDNSDFAMRAALVVTALVLLSPAQFPWYLMWILPFAPLYPVWGMVAASAFVPMYYASFYFLANDTYETFKGVVVWAIWLPVWAVLAWEVFSKRAANFKIR